MLHTRWGKMKKILKCFVRKNFSLANFPDDTDNTKHTKKRKKQQRKPLSRFFASYAPAKKNYFATLLSSYTTQHRTHIVFSFLHRNESNDDDDGVVCKYNRKKRTFLAAAKQRFINKLTIFQYTMKCETFEKKKVNEQTMKRGKE